MGAHNSSTSKNQKQSSKKIGYVDISHFDTFKFTTEHKFSYDEKEIYNKDPHNRFELYENVVFEEPIHIDNNDTIENDVNYPYLLIDKITGAFVVLRDNSFKLDRGIAVGDNDEQLIRLYQFTEYLNHHE